MKFVHIIEKEILKNELFLVPIGDVHYGSKDCDIEKLKQTINWIKNKENTRVILMGDLIDVGLKDSIGAGVFDNNIEPEQQINDIIDLLEPIKDKIWCMLGGNHEERIRQRTSLDVNKIIANALNITYCGINCFIKARIGNENYIIYASHGNSGALTPSGKLNSVMKPATYIDADIYIMGHCMDKKTEILTNDGWKKYFDIAKNDTVLTLNKKTKLLEYNKINNFILNPESTEWVSINNKNTDLLVTKEHKLLTLKPRTNKLEEISANNLLKKYNLVKMINSGQINKSGIYMKKNLLQLLIWIIADGGYHHKKTMIRWHLAKPRKINSLTTLLKKLNLDYRIKESVLTSKRNRTYNIYVDISKLKQLIKILPDIKILPSIIKNANKKELNIILDTYIETDGSITGKNTMQISSAKEKEIDILQEVCIKNGMRCNKISKNNCYVLSINRKKYSSTLTKRLNQVKKVKYKDLSWCVQTDNETLIVRRNGKVSIIHNCHELMHHTTDYFKISLKDKMIIKDKKHYVITGHFLKYGGYAEQKGYAPGKSGVAKIILRSDAKKINVSI